MKWRNKRRTLVLLFLGKFWGLSAWMLELIIVLSIITRNIPDLVVVGVLLVVNGLEFHAGTLGCGRGRGAEEALKGWRARETREDLAGSSRPGILFRVISSAFARGASPRRC